MSLSLKTIKKIINVRLLFGHYHDIQHSKMFIKSYSIIITLLLIYIVFLKFLDISNFSTPSTYTTIEALLNNLVSILFQGRYLKKHYVLMENIKKKMNITKFSITYPAYVCLFLSNIMHSFFILHRLSYSITNYVIWAGIFVIISLCINCVTKFFIFDIVYQTMKLMRIKMQFNIFVNVIGRDRISYKIQNIKTSMLMYQCLKEYIGNLDYEIQTWVNLNCFFVQFLFYFCCLWECSDSESDF